MSGLRRQRNVRIHSLKRLACRLLVDQSLHKLGLPLRTFASFAGQTMGRILSCKCAHCPGAEAEGGKVQLLCQTQNSDSLAKLVTVSGQYNVSNSRTVALNDTPRKHSRRILETSRYNLNLQWASHTSRHCPAQDCFLLQLVMRSIGLGKYFVFFSLMSAQQTELRLKIQAWLDTNSPHLRRLQAQARLMHNGAKGSTQVAFFSLAPFGRRV